jgi:hypothetical protein
MSVSHYQSAAAIDESTTQPSSFDVVIPAGAPIDSIILVCGCRSIGTDSVNVPSGWSVVSGPFTTASNMTSRVYTKKIEAADQGSTVSFTASGGSRTIATWIILQGAGAIADIVVQPSSEANTTSTMTAPTVTTTQTDTMIVTFFLGRRNSTSRIDITPTGSQTERAESNTNLGTAPNLAMSVATGNSNTAAPGSYGGFTATTNAAMTHAHMYTLAVPSGATYKKNQFLPFF